VTHLRKIMLEELRRSSQTGERLVQRRPNRRLANQAKTRIPRAPLGTMRWAVQVRRSGGGVAWEATPPVLVLPAT
jgi:hypothetical protein